eukprot:4371-Heterococcus_DN1.PRE.4
MCRCSSVFCMCVTTAHALHQNTQHCSAYMKVVLDVVVAASNLSEAMYTWHCVHSVPASALHCKCSLHGRYQCLDEDAYIRQAAEALAGCCDSTV